MVVCMPCVCAGNPGNRVSEFAFYFARTSPLALYACLYPWSQIGRLSLSDEASICQRNSLQSGLSHCLTYSFLCVCTAVIWGL